LGLENDPLFHELALKIQKETKELDSLWEEQSKPGYERKWWQDGEYNAEKADE